MLKFTISKYFKMSEKIRALLEHATSQGYKSNVIKPLMGMMIIFVLGGCLTYYLNIEIFGHILLGLATFTGLCMLFAYFFCLFKDPDLLRSEKYNLEKTVIEKVSITGDSIIERGLNLPITDYVVLSEKSKGKNNGDE